uniref:Uncharacterized protein n=1 Tax=Fervidicoccus fontis TaxID=683846 RepID=A0A7J3ZJD1_9CREN
MGILLAAALRYPPKILRCGIRREEASWYPAHRSQHFDINEKTLHTAAALHATLAYALLADIELKARLPELKCRSMVEESREPA